MEDRTKTAQAYQDAIDKSSAIKAAKAYPIIGGCDAYRGNTLDQFDEENDWETETEFYNGYEDL